MVNTDWTFVNRENHLDELRSRYERNRADCIVMYGRRRLGKSALVRESIRNRDDAVYWQATEETPDVQLADFVTAASETYPHVVDIRHDWEPLLRALGREDAVVILDEFPYLIQSDDALPSKIQRVWDTDLEETSMTLVLVGSSISIMEEKVLGGGSPLYGRRTHSIDLPPLQVGDAVHFYPADDADTILQSWGVFGGTPYYLRAIDRTDSLAENIQSLILSEHGVLHNEPEFLVRTEFGIREPQTYYTILRALAQGKREANEIAGFAGVDSNSLGSYLTKLRRLRLVVRDIPVTENPNATRKSRYRLSEPLFRFWFRFVYGQEGKIAQLGETAYEQLVAPEFTDYMGALFESACQRALPQLIPKTYHGIGYWWHKQHELDVVGLADDGTIVAGECKYTSRHMTEGDLARLERTAATIEWTPPDDSDPTYHYCCFCRSGFSEDLKQLAERRDAVTLFTPDEIVAGLTTSHRK
ncbi:ATP-binding protein [Halocatena marina]|uniref:ATP-binding protein n=1 Tax=Halocatena marina TaxID=2934937 RepID=UPI00200C5D10|nr:ATP-binding protein [Halocatena marina]